jgi:outer membrane receptor protein involved in Fe transport
MRILRTFAYGALVAVLLATATGILWAQAVETGQVSGTVTDPSGAVVAGANVTVTAVATQATRTATTDTSGYYLVTALPPATYRVSIEAKGFAKQAANVTVQVGGKTTFDAKLTLGGTTEVVEVTARAEVVQPNTVSQTIGDVVTSTEILQLPTITRNPYDLAAVAGNVSADADGATGRGVLLSINGQRAASTNILLDGGENVDNFTATVGQSVPLDSVQEFSVLSNNYTAEFGRASGGIVNVATKSGTNAFHGSAYEFYRGSALATNTPENAAAGEQKPAFVRNQFGGAAGGPIIKDKLFFFGNGEWTRVRSNVMTNYWVPTTPMLAASDPATQAFFNAYGGKLVATPTGRIATMQYMMDNKSVAPEAGTPLAALASDFPVLQQVAAPVPTDGGGGAPQNTMMAVGRIDLNLNNNTSMFWRYGAQKTVDFAGWVSDSPYAGYNTGEQILNQNIMWSVTHLFSSNLISTTKVLYNRLNDLQPQGALQPTLFYMSRAANNRIENQGAYLPGYLPGSYGSGIPFGGPQNVYQFSEDLGWNKGKHQFKFGVSYIHMRDNRAFGAYGDASMVLGTDWTSALNNLLAGQLSILQTAIYPQGKFPCPVDPTTQERILGSDCQLTLPVTEPKFSRNNRFNDTALYAQDSWRIHPRLMLNLGLRWEYYGVQHNADPKLDSNFYLGAGSNYWQQYRNGSVQIAGQSPAGGLWEPQYHNFAPRVGFAWDLFGNGKTALRGGYGISYERNFGNVTFNVIQNPPNYGVVSVTPNNFGGSLPITVSNFGPLGGDTGTVYIPALSVRHVSQNIKPAYSEMWNLVLEHQFIQNTLVSLAYSGSNGIHLYSLEDPNRLGAGVIYLGDDPSVNDWSRLNNQYGAASYNRANRGYSHYNALNTKVRTQNVGSTGLTLEANYTYAHALDNLSSTFSDSYANYNTGLLDPFNPKLDYGNADFDVRHRLALSAVWDLPFAKDASNPFVKNVVGGWELTPIITFRSGLPYTLFDCTNGYYYCARAQILGPTVSGGNQMVGSNLYALNTTPVATGDYSYYNPLTGLADIGDCTIPGQGATQICPYPANMAHRNAFFGPGASFVTLGIYKNFKLNERMGLQFRTEFYNLFNHPNMYFDSGNLDISGQTCTDITGGGSCQMTGKKYDNRQIQLGLKFTF